MKFERFTDPDQFIRHEWGKNLTEAMGTKQLAPKSIVIRLAGIGIETSAQSVYQWMSGEIAPRPHVMIGLAKILETPPRMLFTLDLDMTKVQKAVAA